MVNVNLSESLMIYFWDSSHRFRDYNVSNLTENLGQVGQGHVVQYSQRSHAMANINLYLSHCIFCQLSPVRYIHISKFATKTNDVQHSQQIRFDNKYLTFYLIAVIMFAFFQRLLAKIVTWNVGPSKFISRSRSTAFVMAPLDNIC